MQCIPCMHASFLTTTCTCDHKLNTPHSHTHRQECALTSTMRSPRRTVQDADEARPVAAGERVKNRLVGERAVWHSSLHAAASSSSVSNHSVVFFAIRPSPGCVASKRRSEGKKSTRGRERQTFSSATVCARQVRSRSTPRHALFSTPPLFPTKDLHMIKRRMGATYSYVSTRTQTHGQHRHHHTHPPPSSSRLRQHKVVPTAVAMQLWPHSLLVFAIVGESHPFHNELCAKIAHELANC